jgi:hypothetical protein
MTDVLDQKCHARLIANRKKVCYDAGIQDKHLRESMIEYCNSEQVDWVRNFETYEAAGIPGLVINYTEKPETVCQAIAGALLRNFIDARVMSLHSVLDACKEEADLLAPHVLLIPNLYLQAPAATLQPWRIEVLHDLLLDRKLHSRMNVLYVESMEGLKSAYGQPFANHLSDYKLA